MHSAQSNPMYGRGPHMDHEVMGISMSFQPDSMYDIMQNIANQRSLCTVFIGAQSYTICTPEL